MQTQNLRLVEPQIKKLGRIAAILILILIISGSLFTIITPFFGWRTEAVISGSMEPAISTGSVVIIRPVIPDTIRKGDVIMYYSPDKTSLTTHSVFYVASEPSLQFITKGDANNSPDVIPITPGQIIGIVALTIPYLGLVAQFIKTPFGFTLFLLIPAVILIGHEMLELWRGME
jgi:signal peptidase I